MEREENWPKEPEKSVLGTKERHAQTPAEGRGLSGQFEKLKDTKEDWFGGRVVETEESNEDYLKSVVDMITKNQKNPFSYEIKSTVSCKSSKALHDLVSANLTVLSFLSISSRCANSEEKCTERNKHIRIRYKPSLFQHVGIQSSFPGREQYFKVSNLKCS
ncbi:hypothetical protein J1605_010099 [Eschrichtius robustus]|uniref:Uncharacterized protein n=1 Tax=Eschrichtius robustus TaxID=9764 RepID=A0AB34GUC1_ESCRO|nr:hypothetical protein J1605_010099 [Eschrichtius robustus]